MSLFDRIWRQAGETFGKRNGHEVVLTPYSRTWLTVLERSEHALWVWNDKYGPLTPSQREYACELILHALRKAGEQSDVGNRFAFFHTTLTGLLNHEKVDRGFKSRASSENVIGDLIGDVFQSVTA